MSIKFLGTGFYVPDRIVTNDELATMVETNDEWITQRVGVRERRVSVDETASDFAVKASLEALKSAEVDACEIDLIVAATISSENLCPTVAGTVQRAIGAKCPAFDISSACSGFLFALETAVSFIARGNYKKVLVIGAERLSKIVDWSDRSTCVIFGDGAGAAVIEPGENYLSSLLYTSGGNEVIEIPSFTGTSPFYKGKVKHPYIFMDGQETFKFAVKKIVDDIKKVAADAGIDISEVDYWNELVEIMEWTKTNVTSTFHICWAAQAGLYYHYGIPKYPLDRKLSGVYKHKVNRTTAKLVRGFDTQFFAPHSRHTEVKCEDIKKVKELELLAESDEAGAYIIFTKGGRQIFVTGHSEYDADTLKLEYERDLAKGMNPDIPKNYFPDDDPTKKPMVRWRSHASMLFANWLNYFVYQITPYDIKSIH